MIRGREAFRREQPELAASEWEPTSDAGRKLAKRWEEYIAHMRLHDKEIQHLTVFKADAEKCGITPGSTFRNYRIDLV